MNTHALALNVILHPVLSNTNDNVCQTVSLLDELTLNDVIFIANICLFLDFLFC